MIENSYTRCPEAKLMWTIRKGTGVQAESAGSAERAGRLNRPVLLQRGSPDGRPLQAEWADLLMRVSVAFPPKR